MNKRKIQLIAVAVLIVGPLTANILAKVLPGQPALQPLEFTPPPAPPPNPLAMLPQPLAAPPAPSQASGPAMGLADGTTMSTQPMLETAGVSVDPPADPALAVAAPPAPPPPAPMAQIAMPAVGPAAGPAAGAAAVPHLPPPSAVLFREGPRR